MNKGTILNSITTGLHTLEGMGIRMIDNFVGGYLNFICILSCLTCMNWRVWLIAVMGAAVSLIQDEIEIEWNFDDIFSEQR